MLMTNSIHYAESRVLGFTCFCISFTPEIQSLKDIKKLYNNNYNNNKNHGFRIFDKKYDYDYNYENEEIKEINIKLDMEKPIDIDIKPDDINITLYKIRKLKQYGFRQLRDEDEDEQYTIKRIR